MTSRKELQTRLAELSSWQTATRDDAQVASALHETRTMDQVYPLSEAAFFDELFHYLREIGAWELLEDLDPKNREGALYPFLTFVLVTIMRCVGGVQSMLATRDVLLTDEALMGVLGFNAAQVRDGSNDRGLSRRTKPVEIRGAFSYETVADNIVAVGKDKLVAMFNGVVRCLAKQGIFPKRIDALLDATDDEATPGYETDDGKEVPSVTREKRPDVRANRPAKKTKVTVFGWKVWVVWEPVSRIPLAIAIDGINVADNEHAYEVVAQARKNVEGYATIRSVALDRGFLDGNLLSKIDGEGAIVYLPAKSNLTITTDAREIARRAEALAAQGRALEGTTYKERVEKVQRGAGKNATAGSRWATGSPARKARRPTRATLTPAVSCTNGGGGSTRFATVSSSVTRSRSDSAGPTAWTRAYATPPPRPWPSARRPGRMPWPGPCWPTRIWSGRRRRGSPPSSVACRRTCSRSRSR